MNARPADDWSQNPGTSHDDGRGDAITPQAQTLPTLIGRVSRILAALS
jgi:hypothetical protein